MSSLEVISHRIEGLASIKHRPVSDDRGRFSRIFCRNTLSELLEGREVMQINHSHTSIEGTVRGMHFQFPPQSEVKIVTCMRGAVWDVAVDLRRGSPTFLQYQAVTLSEDDDCSFLVPEGFAHGFQTLAPDSELLYLHTAEFDPESEGSVNAIDPMLAIDWPRRVSNRSERDSQVPMLDPSFKGISES